MRQQQHLTCTMIKMIGKGMRTLTPAASITTTQGAMLKMLTSISTPATLVVIGSHSYENTAGAAHHTQGLCHIPTLCTTKKVHELTSDVGETGPMILYISVGSAWNSAPAKKLAP